VKYRKGDIHPLLGPMERQSVETERRIPYEDGSTTPSDAPEDR